MFLFRKNTMSLFLAWRYLTWQEKSSFTKFAMRISIFAVAIGAGSLLTAIMITQGTKKAIYNKIKTLTGHTVFYKSSSDKINLKDLYSTFYVPAHLRKNVLFCPGAVTSVVLKDKNDSFFNVFLKAVDFKTVDQVLDINKCLEGESSAGSILASGDMILVGSSLIEHLGGLPNTNLIEISVPEFKSRTSVRLKPVNLQVGGIYKTGLNEFDSGVIFCSLETFWKIYKNEGQVDHLIVRISKKGRQKSSNPLVRLWNKFFGASFSQKVLTGLVRANPGLVKTDWKETYQSLISCMELEKNITLLIIFLIALIAMINLSSVLVLQIQAKKRDITVLKVFGVSVAQIKGVFFAIAMALVSMGTFIGALVSLGCALFFTHKYPLLLPEGYFIDRIFFDINPIYFLGVLLLMLICGLLASFIPMAWILKIEVNQGLSKD